MNRGRAFGNSSGFTLVELLVVVLIIGVLASIGVPQYVKVVERGRVAEAMSCIQTMKAAQERYFLKNSRYWGSGGADVSGLDVPCPTLKNFLPPNTYGDTVGFWIYMYRNQPVATYGQYYVMIHGGGYDYIPMQCSQWTATPDPNVPCQRDLMP